jgi:hypothetical protein
MQKNNQHKNLIFYPFLTSTDDDQPGNKQFVVFNKLKITVWKDKPTANYAMSLSIMKNLTWFRFASNQPQSMLGFFRGQVRDTIVEIKGKWPPIKFTHGIG